MARKLYYKIIDDGQPGITDEQWMEISRIQYWYNAEFFWTAGKLALKRYLVFANPEYQHFRSPGVEKVIRERRLEYEQQGLSERDILQLLEKEQCIIVKRGGYLDGCIASGFTRVASNELNAFLVCDFLLKVSTIIPTQTISVVDEGAFIKTKNVRFQNADVHIPQSDTYAPSYYQNIVDHRHVFSIVDGAKYNAYPQYRTVIPDFNEKSDEERQDILHEWNWLGFDNNYDENGDDIRGFNLNEKVREFILVGK